MNQRNPDRSANTGGQAPGPLDPSGSYGEPGVRQKGGSSGYADVSDFGRGGGDGGTGSGIDYGAAANRGNQDFARGDDGGHSTLIDDAVDGLEQDERIREGVCERLAILASRGHLDPSRIEVSVENGAVTLTGTVPHAEWKQGAEDVVQGLGGVHAIDNCIRVRA